MSAYAIDSDNLYGEVSSLPPAISRASRFKMLARRLHPEYIFGILSEIISATQNSRSETRPGEE